MARGFGAAESSRKLVSDSSYRLKEARDALARIGSAKALRHADAIKKNEKVIERALREPAFAATLYAPSPNDERDYDKSIVQREVYEAYKAAGRASELPKMQDVKDLWDKFGKDAKRETMFEADKDGVVVVAHSGKYLGVTDKSVLSRYGAGKMNRDGVAWHNHPDNGPDGRSYGFPPSPPDVIEMLQKGHRTWYVGTSEGLYEMTVNDKSRFRAMDGKELEQASNKFAKELHNVWLETIRVCKPGCMKDAERGVVFTNVLNVVLRDKLAEVGIEYRFKPEKAGFKKV